ncbi:MAG: LarC family nickel insertion protein, partial [Clostridiales bacterium]|nr:LarC family nickel insertion protein [Clostridiales bacterium]
GETVTPTGAALVTALSEPQNFGPYPPCTVESVGYGAGSRDFPFPNLLRVIIGEQSEQAQTVEVIRASIDDMNPEQLGYLWEKAFAAGALDMTYTPLIMKKGRPGVGLTLTAQCGQAADLARLIFAETTTSGLRVSREERIVLPRKKETVSTAYGEIEIKISGEGPGRTVAPEFESCRAAAQKSGAPLKAVYQAALAAAANKGGAI